MRQPNRRLLPGAPSRGALVAASLALVLAACGGGSGSGTSYSSNTPFQVGVSTSDSSLPAEPSLPTDAQVCTTLEADPNLVKRPDGALTFEADKTQASGAAVVSADTTHNNPDQARIQAALNACGVAVDAEVGSQIAAADAAAAATQVAANTANGTSNNISGASAQSLAQYKASKFAVRLVASSTGSGNAFISGPLTLPSGVTLWIDKGVTLFASRDVMLYNNGKASNGLRGTASYCGNTNVQGSSGSSGNCAALITGTNLVNSAIVGDGAIDSRGYAEIITSNKLYPMMKVDLTCSNTYTAYKTGTQAANGTACDDGGTIVDTSSTSRNMTWWDLAYLGNMVQNGTTGAGSQSNFRMMVFNYAKNLTLYRITLNNSANFHVVPSGVDNFIVWGVKVQTPSLAAYANPAGNSNPLYTGDVFGEDNVKNTDAFDPGSAGGATQAALTTGVTATVTTPTSGTSTYAATGTTSSAKIYFDGYLKNFVFAYNYVSTGDDDMALKGSSNPCPASQQATTSSVTIGGTAYTVTNSASATCASIDGSRDVATDRAYGMVVAHNHFYWGHGISVGSETNAGVKNVQVYDNSFRDSEEGLRIKSDYARGGEVSNIYYKNICIQDATNSLLFTPYYSTKAISSGKVMIPNFHDIHLENVRLQGTTAVKLMGYAADPTGFGNPQYPLVMSLTNVVADTPSAISLIDSDATLTLSGVNLPILADTTNRVVVNGAATQAVDPSQVVDCSNAYVDFPSGTSPAGTTW